MTAVPTFVFHGVQASHLDDNMDTTSSPVRQADDIDLDLDQMREPSVEPNADNMMDDATEVGDNHDHLLADNISRTEDDRMSVAELYNEADNDEIVRDFDMEAGDMDHVQYEDEDILYDEDGFVDQQEDFQHVELLTTDENLQDDLTHNVEQQYTEPGDGDIHEESNVIVADDTYDEKNNPTLLTAEGDTDSNYQDDEAGNLDDNAIEEHADVHRDEHISLEAQTANIASEPANDFDERNRVTSEPTNTLSDDRSLSAEAPLRTKEQTLEDSLDDPNEEDDGQTAADESTMVGQPEAEPAEIEIPVNFQTNPLHDVKLLYLGEELSLFPPIQDTTTSFFLSDMNLASEKLTRLLEACREILADSIGHDDELVLDIPALGLHICEDSKYAEQLTLTQVIDVYMALNQNEQAAPIPPIHCSLTSRVCLASQYAYLVSAAQSGRKFSEVASDYVDSPEAGYLGTTDPLHRQNHEFVDREDAGEVDDDDSESHRSMTGEVQPGPVAADQEPAVNLEPAEVDNIDEDSHEVEQTDPATEIVEEAGGEAVTNPTEQLDDDLHQAAADTIHEQYTIFAENPLDDEDALQELGHDNQQALQTDVDQLTHKESTTDVGAETEPAVNDTTQSQDDQDDSSLQAPLRFESAVEPELVTEYEAFDDEEFFLKSDDESQDETEAEVQEVFVDSVLLEPEGDETAQLNGQIDEPDPAAPTLQSTGDVLSEQTQPTPPATPAKVISSKRKILEDDDEFDLLDSSTPEPKRTRPS